MNRFLICELVVWSGQCHGFATEAAPVALATRFPNNGGVAVVLLVEDDRAVREGLELALRRQGHVVHASESGERGLDLLHAQHPDIVVLDLMLPGIDGFETCRRLRGAAEVPIIMLTARGDDFGVVAGLEAPISAPVSVTLGGTPTVTVPFAIRGLPSLAVSQLACTAIAVSRSANGSAGINLVGLDGPAGFRQQCSG
jgi:CheY-like chemotaxis protein